MLGDINLKRKNWHASLDNYSVVVSANIGEKQSLPPELHEIQLTFGSFTVNKRDDAEVTANTYDKVGINKTYYVSGKATYPCINCLGEGKIVETTPTSMDTSRRCPTCNGKGKFVQKPPLTQFLR